MSQTSLHIHINGIVQGVGFRPFIYNLAECFGLKGWVRNSASGVDIEITGSKAELNAFLEAIPGSAPPLAQIDSIDSHPIETQAFDLFTIVKSKGRSSDFIPVSPDVAICKACSAEMFNPEDRRYRYPFINCTNCGPRFSIIKDIPYDRPQTTMAGFDMCENCLAEYENPKDRRFHAQPIACPECGPQVWFEITPGKIEASKAKAIVQARQSLSDGKILAIKGLGGFHLACDAGNPKAVARLRERKGRLAKPFALMAFDLETVQSFVKVSPKAEQLLLNPQAPIVLLPKKPEIKLATNVAPGQANLGFMLPYTPLHLLLLEPAEGFPEALVMTSGNLSEEPILHENQNAREKLASIADAFLLHNRPIHRRIDDSVFAILQDQPYPIRRARGYAPNPIRLAEDLPQILAVGPQMKNTFCLTRDRYAFISHHIGEMDHWETYQEYKESVKHFEFLFRIQPQAIAYDMHPDYTTTHYALERVMEEELPGFPVQHHHAHLAAGMIENGLSPSQTTAGLIFDGTGYGEDGTIWGGEILVGNCLSFKRFAHLKPVPLPGGDVTVRKPARMALSMLYAYGLPWDEDLPPVQYLSMNEKKALTAQLEGKLNTSLTSSMGRLFDAVSALLGISEQISYEAQAAIELETLADPDVIGYYPWQLDGEDIDIQTLLVAILADLKNGKEVPSIAGKFHNTIAQMSLEIALNLNKAENIDKFVLSGGVWQNRLLLEKTIALMHVHNLQPLIHRQTPPNDGCVAFGQALVAAYRYKQKEN
jgi:hydrogenase maturation protein HypF